MSTSSSSSPRGMIQLLPLIAVWYLSALVTVTTSNIILATSTASPLLLTYLQLSLSTLAQFIFFEPLKDILPNAKKETPRYLPPLTLPPSRNLGNPEKRQLSISTISFLLGFLLTNYTFSLTSAAVTETVKTMEPLSTAGLSWWGGLESFELKDVASMGVTMLGVKLAVSTATDGRKEGGSGEEGDGRGGGGGFTILAAGAVLISNLAFSTRSVAMGKIRKSMENRGDTANSREIFYRMTHQGTILLTPFILLWCAYNLFKHGLSGINIFSLGVVPTLSFQTPFLLITNVCLWMCYNASSTMLLTLLSPTVHALLNVLRRLVIIVGTSYWFEVYMGAKGWAGVGLAIGGMAAFKVGRAKGKETVRGKKVWL